ADLRIGEAGYNRLVVLADRLLRQEVIHETAIGPLTYDADPRDMLVDVRLPEVVVKSDDTPDVPGDRHKNVSALNLASDQRAVRFGCDEHGLRQVKTMLAHALAPKEADSVVSP